MSSLPPANSKLETRNSKPVVSIIAALAENRVIGADNALPWRLPEDLRHFRRLTTGHAVIMGRRNYESIGKPLPQRRNIVVSRNPGYVAPGCVVVPSLEAAFAAAGDDPEVFVIGGGEIYRQALARADRMYLTLVHATVAGDVRFPSYDARDWQERAREFHPPDERHAWGFSFVTLERRR
jgi:dihydrofolate reductase